MKLILLAFKIDSFYREITFTVAIFDNKACLVKILYNLFRWEILSNISLFQLKSYLFTRKIVTNNLREILIILSVEDYYLEHFFRRSATTSTRDIDLSNNEIQLLSRWKLDFYRLYIVIYLAYIFRASLRY